MDGYQVNWNILKHNPDKEKAVNKVNGKPTLQSKIVTVELSRKRDNTIDMTPIVSDNNFIVSTDNNHFIISQKEKVILPVRNMNTLVEVKQPNVAFTVENAKNKMGLKVEKGRGYSVLALAGFICSIAGLLLIINLFFIYFLPFLLVQLILTGTLTLLGAIFSAIGIEKTGKYYKRGKAFAIAGFIIGVINFVMILLGLLIIAIFLASI